MASYSSITTLDAALKVIYHRYQDLTYEKRPFLGLLPKRQVTGKTQIHPLKYGHGTSGAATFTKAQANYAAPSMEAWEVSMVRDYAVGRVDRDATLAGTGPGAVVDAVTNAADSIMKHLSDSIARRIYRRRSGDICGVGSVASTTITLDYAAHANLFEVGMVLVACYDNSGTWDYRGGSTGTEMTVTKVDRTAGTITVDAAAAGLAANDRLFRSGDNYQTASHGMDHAGLCMAGLYDWVNPFGAPSGTTIYATTFVPPATLFGVDRSVDSRLGGCRLDASAYGSLQDALIDAAARAGEDGGDPRVCLLNPRKFSALVKEIGSKDTYGRLPAIGADGKEIADIGYETVRIRCDTGVIDVVSDRFCPFPYGWMINQDEFVLESYGPLMDFDQFDNGRRWQQLPTYDGYECRGISYPQLVCEAPGHQCAIKLP